MKFFTILASILLLFFTTILILGVVLESEFSVMHTISIEAPQVVIYKKLLEFDTYQDWCPNITKSLFHPENNTRTTIYKFHEKKLQLSESVQVVENEGLVIFIQNDSLTQSYIQKLTNQIKAEENPDGSTEIEWKISYSIKPILSKIISRMIFLPALENILDENLRGLKKEIEG